ncbi:MAG: hotdog fold thioesterase [Clostridia bacterium]|nr:hotdog fold thioesterase [Clostridia bacterium]
MMEEIYKRFSMDRFAKLCGIAIDDIKSGYAVTSVTINENHLNGVDITQGGLIYTLADVAFAAATNSYGPVAVGLTTNISFFRKSEAGNRLEAIAHVISKTRKTCSVDVEVTCEGQLIAKMTGTAYIKND